MSTETVSLEQIVLEKLRKLPVEKQQEVSDFVGFLVLRHTPRHPKRSAEGLCADLGLHVSEEDIAEARREMWGNFPREDIL